MILEPGDLLNTGTPAGRRARLADQPYLRPGDHVELEIDLLGRAAQYVVAALVSGPGSSVVALARTLVAGLSDGEQAAVFAGSAAWVYGR
jgi:hypothetical protein